MSNFPTASPFSTNMKPYNRYIWIIGLMLTAVFLISCGVQAGETTAQTEETAVAFVGDLSANVTASGQVMAQRAASLVLGITGLVQQVNVAVGDTVQAGEVLVQLETADLERAVANAEQALIIQEANLAELQAPPAAEELTSAQADVASAQANLNDVLDGPGADEIAAAEADVRAAQADVAAASARLNSQQPAPGQAEIEAAQIQLQLAQAAATQAAEQHSSILVTEPNEFLTADRLADLELSARAAAVQANADLAAAQEALDSLLQGDGNAIASAGAGLASAAAKRDAAQAQLDILLQGPGDVEIAAAELQLAQTQATLDSLMAGTSAEQLAIAAAQVEQARISLEKAKLNLAEASLVAPFDGVVTAVHLAEGELASGLAIELVDLDSLEVVLDVDEVDIGLLAVGQEAIITLESYPDAEIPGEIVAIGPQAAEGDTVTYPVHLSLTQTELSLRVGMTANAQLVTAEHTDVLLVPNQAITADREANNYYVNLVSETENGRTYTQVEVTIGLRDNQYTEITNGLTEGDTVLLGALPTQTEDEGGPFGGGPGDGPGGGFGG